MSDLPSICKDHPNAEIRHEWDESYYILNGFRAGPADKTDHKYFCNECGRELCSPQEYQERMMAKWG